MMSKLPQIPGYKLIRKLGHGGMADVFLGIQENLQREVAIKILESSLFRDEQFAGRFKNEAQTAARLAHPNIVTIHDTGQIRDIYYIVMEYLPDSLKTRMENGGIMMPPSVALDIIKMVATALEYAHNKGVIHRDIKSDNIMFRSDGTAVLVDFGIARASDSSDHLTRTGTSIGTPHYMSPEQCRGEKIDGRSDIYALGVQLYELLTGKLPYKAENTTGVILKHIQDPVPLLPVELRQYQPLLNKMMAKDKELRISSGAELIKFIDGFLTAQDQQLMPAIPLPPETQVEIAVKEHVSIPALQPAAAPWYPKQPGRKKWLLPSLLALIIIIATGTALYFSTHSRAVTTETALPNTGPSIADTHSTTALPGKLTQPKTSITAKSSDTPTPPTGQGKESQPKAGHTPKNTPKNETTPPFSRQFKIATVLELHPDIQNEYNSKLEQLQVPILNPNLKVVGQVVVNLAINENGKITIQTFQDMLLVTPLLQERLVKMAIGKRLNNISLPPPKNKKDEPVRVSNWRVRFKVGKVANKIILTKQN